jgi:hypothetical protein
LKRTLALGGISLRFDKVAFSLGNWYNSIRVAEVAQQVEQRTENPRVASPILALGTIFERK